jgi:glycosyltransferase involved in cell wall biosynthesis
MNDANAGVWIIIPAYEEGERLGATLASLEEFLPRIVVIDDGSTDGTAAEAVRHPVWLLRHSLNRGQGAALQTGIDFALERGAEIIVTFDADGQHSGHDVAALVEPVRKGSADVALGSRFLGKAVGLPPGRRLILKLGIVFTRIFSRIQVSDTHNGLRAFSRAAAECISITHDRMAHASEILDQIRAHGLRYQEVPVTIHYTPGTLAKGQSSWNALKMAGQLILGRLLR